MTQRIPIIANIQADAKNVREYYTQPKYIINWNFADPSWHCPSTENNIEVGGKYLAHMEARDGSFGFDFDTIQCLSTDSGV